MGLRGEVFSSRVVCEGRTYFFNVKENRTGDLYLAIVESKPTETESFDRRSIVVFKENVQEFLQSFEKALAAMEKTAATRSKGKRHASRKPAAPTAGTATTSASDPETQTRKPRVIRPRRDAEKMPIPPAVAEKPRRMTVKKRPSTTD